MATLEETLAAFGQPQPYVGPQGAPPGPDEIPGNGPLDQALLTLQQFGAATPQYVPPPAPPPMPVGPAAPQGIIPPQGLGPLQPAPDQGMGAAAPQAQPAPQFTPPKPPGSLAEAGAQTSAAIGEVGATAYSAADARAQAEVSRGQAIADVQDRGVKLREEMQAATVVARQRANADADLETAGWIQELQDQAAREPNPSRWWENQSRLSKALWAIGLIAGAAHAAQTPGAKNAAWEVVRQEMAADMEEQRVRLGKQLTALKAKGETMSARHQRVASDMRDDHTYGLTRIEALERAFMARATAPGDLDAAALKAEAQAQFAQMKLPFIDGYRKEKLAEKNAAIARQHDRGMQAARLAHDTREREAQNKFTQEQAERKFGYDLALSPVSTSVAYKPGGAIPLDKDGIPVLSEMQAGKAAGLYLKGPDGKPTGNAPRFRKYEEMTAASEVVSKANTRYTASKKLLDVLDGMDGGTMEALKQGVLGTTNPQLADVVNQLGYEIAKSHDARITNQDFSKGVSQAMGFDPDGNWLQRGKFVMSVDEIKAKLRADINAMPEKVHAQFRDKNDAAINGQGTELVWDPNMLAGEPAPPERSSAEIRGEAPAAKPVEGLKDYRERRGAAAADPERKHELPDHDTSYIDRIANTAVGTGPKTVRAEAARVLDEIKAKEAELTKRMQDASDPWGTRMDEATQAKAMAELERLRQTRTIAETVAADAEADAQTRVVRVGKKVEALAQYDWVDEQWVRKQAAEMGLNRAEDEVARLIELSKTIKKQWGKK